MKNLVASLLTFALMTAAACAQPPDTVWTNTYGWSHMGWQTDDYGMSVQQTSDGGFIIAGYSFMSPLDVYWALLIKTDSNGDTAWLRTYGGINLQGFSVQHTEDGGYIVAGSSWMLGYREDVYVFKTDSEGDTVWTRFYGGELYDFGNSVDITSDGGYIIAGGAYSFSHSYSDVYLIKIDADGDTIWTRTYGGSENDFAECVQHTLDGGYIITGNTTSFGVLNPYLYLIKTDADGDTVWTRTFGGESWEYGYDVRQTSDV